MLQLNLLPDVKKELLHAKRMRNLVMTVCIFVSIGAGAVVVVMALWLGILAVNKDRMSKEVDKNIAIVQGEMREKETTSEDGETVKNLGLGDYLSVQNDLTQINAIKETQPQLSRLMGYLDAVFGRTTPVTGLSWDDWQEIKISANDENAPDAVTIELSGKTSSTTSRLMLRNRLYYAMVKYSEYKPDGSGAIEEGETKSDQKLFPNMVPTVDFEGSAMDDTSNKWPFVAKLTFNPIVFQTKYRIQAIEIDNCKVWSATYGTIGAGCQGTSSESETATQNGGQQ
jgi:hypothetical protein